MIVDNIDLKNYKENMYCAYLVVPKDPKEVPRDPQPSTHHVVYRDQVRFDRHKSRLHRDIRWSIHSLSTLNDLER